MKEGEKQMAIKVIKKGHRKTVARAVCRVCHSVLEYTEADVRVSQMYNDEDHWITCPICGTVIDVDMATAFPWVEPEPEIYEKETDPILLERQRDVSNGWIYT